MTDDLLDLSHRDSLKAGFDGCIDQSFLHPGIAPEDLRLEGELSEQWLPEDRLSISGLEGSVLIAVPMPGRRIGSFV
jgi:hypothetical protein